MAFLKGVLYFLTLRWVSLYRHIRAEKIKSLQKQKILEGAMPIQGFTKISDVKWNAQQDCWETEITVLVMGHQNVLIARTNAALDITNVYSKY
jgi:hypothetical protein